MVTFLFNPSKNYIGNKNWQYKYTKYISKFYPDINFTAYKHDYHYDLLLAERKQTIRLVLKIVYDLVFLILGITRLLFKSRFDGIIFVIVLYIILLFSSINYLYINKDINNNLSKEK